SLALPESRKVIEVTAGRGGRVVGGWGGPEPNAARCRVDGCRGTMNPVVSDRSQPQRLADGSREFPADPARIPAPESLSAVYRCLGEWRPFSSRPPRGPRRAGWGRGVLRGGW